MVQVPLYSALIQSTSAQEEHEVGKIPLDRLLTGTQPSVQASELVRGQHGWRPLSLVELDDVAARVGDLGVVAASKGVYAEKRCGDHESTRSG